MLENRIGITLQVYVTISFDLCECKLCSRKKNTPHKVHIYFDSDIYKSLAKKEMWLINEYKCITIFNFWKDFAADTLW